MYLKKKLSRFCNFDGCSGSYLVLLDLNITLYIGNFCINNLIFKYYEELHRLNNIKKDQHAWSFALVGFSSTRHHIKVFGLHKSIFIISTEP